MAIHMSIRLAWHSDGWNGHICKKPCENVYCVGQHSYPGNQIAGTRDLDFETEHAGEPCALYPCRVACGLSVNTFGKETIQVKVDPPSWWKEGEADAGILTLPPYTTGTWCYEAMYGEEALSDVRGRTYDNDKRRRNAEAYFEQFEEGKSLVFYYAGYSNPFSEEEQDNYVIVGISRIKKIHDFHYYENATDQIKADYADGLIWQKPVTSMYPDEGLRIPYWKYMENEEALSHIVIKPLHRSPFKYGSREVSDDDAIEIIQQLIGAVDYLIKIGDDTENWELRRGWLGSVLNELWRARGPYPGFASALINIGLHELVPSYIGLSNEQEMKGFRDEVKELLAGEKDEVRGHKISGLRVVRREFMLREEEEQRLLLDILPRFDLTGEQMGRILGENRGAVSIRASLSEIAKNPYIIFEQYQGMEPDDAIPFYKIDNGIIASPEYGLENIFDPGATERLRAFCVDELNRIAAHSFGKAETILKYVNGRLERMPEWKRYTFKLKNFKIEREILEKALFLKEDKELYLYLRWVWEDEREIRHAFTMLTDRPDISFKLAISREKFKNKLRNPESKLNEAAPEQYEAILEKQADICMQIFSKPLCVLSGAAGTGKTTVIKAIVENIERVHGRAAGFLLMAPTGKAAERIKLQTGKDSSTIHSFLAGNGWLNENMTLKRTGGKQGQEVNTIILDECSMIDLNLFATLIRSINWNTVQRLILVGDPNQLPPIGRGRVFADTIDWLNREYPNNVGVLSENIRQLVNRVEKNGCGILDLAGLFIQEKQADEGGKSQAEDLKFRKEKLFEKILFQGNGDVDKDLGVYFWKEQEDLEETLYEAMVRDMESVTGLTEYGTVNDLWIAAIRDKEDSSRSNPDAIQVISPYRGEFYGTDALNTLLQKDFNPSWSRKYTLDGISYYDKVIQFKNRPKSDMAYAYNRETKMTERHEVFNGEIGLALIHPFDYKDYRYKNQRTIEKLQVAFSNKSRQNLRYIYGKNLWKDSEGKYIPEQRVADNLELAYAISVHKSQGSEFDYVYLVIPGRDSHLLSMELLYTAITRARRKVTVFLQEDMSTLSSLGHMEKSAVRRINSSVFNFRPLPEELLYSRNWHADEKRLATLSEYFVRSKSEVIIANMLSQENVPFVYEEPLYAPDGTMYLPDFTVKFRGETYYWEHVGMLHRYDYRVHWEEKKKWYEKHFPGRLLITFESENLSREAMKIIEEYR